MIRAIIAGILVLAGAATALEVDEVYDAVTHGYVETQDGIKIHYAELGEGPLVVLVHGFPDYWYSWRHQIAALASEYRVVAIDTRGYNRSDKPKGVLAYRGDKLVGDVVAVIQALGGDKPVTLMGHDWGGAISWTTAMMAPQLVERLVIFNLPHPNGFSRELANNPEQQEMSDYAREFQKPDSHEKLTPEILANFFRQTPRNEADKKRYIEAMERSSMEALMNYYRAGYPRPPYEYSGNAGMPKIKVPVLQFHGTQDQAIHTAGVNNTWELMDAPWTLVTVPDAGHWVQQDQPELVNSTLLDWLERN